MEYVYNRTSFGVLTPTGAETHEEGVKFDIVSPVVAAFFAAVPDFGFKRARYIHGSLPQPSFQGDCPLNPYDVDQTLTSRESTRYSTRCSLHGPIWE